MVKANHALSNSALVVTSYTQVSMAITKNAQFITFDGILLEGLPRYIVMIIGLEVNMQNFSTNRHTNIFRVS